ncbi:thymidylate synthase [Agrobacterium salinitolerans]|uniref:thymidylate synthase n=1 Tax=Agrobacterium salinitolerans TaxID=1183413 RepID=UPI0015722DFB|nr:thymidylate synthase [Agrobacterium salinitolerans]NTA37607.1 thymidylate synthase [Agrobacterium salinitolerans]
MPRHPEYQYLNLIEHLLEKGDRRIDRTGVGTLSTFGAMMRFDLSDGTFPVYTTKRVYWKTAVKEMLWFLTGQTNIQSLLRENVNIWTDWPLDKYRKATGEDISQKDFEAKILADDDFAAKWGDLGPVYGKQWRRWLANGVEYDQVATLIETLRTNPASRRMLFHAWNVAELDQMALAPCHMTYQFYVSEMGEGAIGNTDPSALTDANAGKRGKLSLLVGQRSCDVGLGNPFNVTQEAALLHMIAQQVDMVPGELIWVGGDVHLYLNHLDLARTILSREPRPFPKLRLKRRPASIDDYTIDDFEVTGYDPHPAIEAPVAV